MNGDLTGLKVKRKSCRKILIIPSQQQVLPPLYLQNSSRIVVRLVSKIEMEGKNSRG